MPSRFGEFIRTGDMRSATRREKDGDSQSSSHRGKGSETRSSARREKTSSGKRKNDGSSSVSQTTATRSSATHESPNALVSDGRGAMPAPWMPPEMVAESLYLEDGETNIVEPDENSSDNASGEGNVPNDQDERYSDVSADERVELAFGDDDDVVKLPAAPTVFDQDDDRQSQFSDNVEHVDAKSRKTVRFTTRNAPSVKPTKSTGSERGPADAYAPAVYVERTLAPYRSVDGDAKSVNAPAVRYLFETSSMTWRSSPVFLRVLHPNRPYHRDEQHMYFAAEYVLNARTSIPMVAKVFLRSVESVREDDYFGEAQCQAMAETFVRRFNRLRPRPGEELPIVPLLTCRCVCRIAENDIPYQYVNDTTGFFSYRALDTREVVFIMEPNTVECLQSQVSFATEMNMVSYPPTEMSKTELVELADAFSHFTYSQSSEQLVVTGLQRYAGYFVDPVVYSADHQGYGMTNVGARGMKKWQETHVCNPLCRTIALRPMGTEASAAAGPPPKITDAEIEANYYVNVSRHLINYRDACVPNREEAQPQRQPSPPPPAAEPFVMTTERKKKKKSHKAAKLPALAGTEEAEAPVEEAEQEEAATEVVEVTTVLTMAPLVTGEEEAESAQPATEAMEPEQPPTVIAASKLEAPAAAEAEEVAPVVAAAVAPVPEPPKKKKKSALLRGCKYVFEKETQRWFPVDVEVIIHSPNEAVFTDATSKVYSAELVLAGGNQTAEYHARVLTADTVNDVDYYNIMDAYVLASQLATAFNAHKASVVFKKFIHFMEREVIRVRQYDFEQAVRKADRDDEFFQFPCSDSRDLLFILEPVNVFKIYDTLAAQFRAQVESSAGADTEFDEAGSPTKSSMASSSTSTASSPLRPSVANEVTEWRQVLETFYHYSFLRTGRYATVTVSGFAKDIPTELCEASSAAGADNSVAATERGVGGSLVNPLVNTYDSNGFPGMNSGNSAVMSFVQKHRCNKLCGLLNLPLVSSSAANGPTAKPKVPPNDPYKIVPLVKNVCAHYIFPAQKFTFNMDTLAWEPSDIFVRVCTPDVGFAMGVMRVVFEVTEISTKNALVEKPLLAKMYLHKVNDVVERDYYNEGAMQNICCYLADRFSEKAQQCQSLVARGDTTDLRFVPLSVVSMSRENLPSELFSKRKGFFSYKTKDTQKILFTVEEKLEGTYTKYNNNGDKVFVTSEVKLGPQETRRRTQILEAAEALSHFSLLETEGAMLACDIQGVDNRLTDPEIHTHDGQGLGLGNLGREGMQGFVGRHRCNYVCKALQLTPFSLRVPELQAPESNRYVQILNQLNNLPTSAAPLYAPSPAPMATPPRTGLRGAAPGNQSPARR